VDAVTLPLRFIDVCAVNDPGLPPEVHVVPDSRWSPSADSPRKGQKLRGSTRWSKCNNQRFYERVKRDFAIGGTASNLRNIPRLDSSDTLAQIIARLPPLR
jgi:hypothetical protein